MTRLATALIAVALLLAGATTARAAMDIRMALTDPVGSAVYRAVDEVFKKEVESKTNGAVTVTLYPSSQLGTYKEALEQIHAGALTAIYESIGIIGPWDPIAGIETVPFLYADEADFFKKWRSPVAQQMLDQLAANSGFRLVGPAYRGFRVMSVNKKVEKIEDVAGLKLRVPAIPIYIETWKTFGANPTPIAFEEVYTSIQQGVVLGQENAITTIYDNHFDEVCKYLVLTNHGAETLGVIFNENWYKQLAPDVRIVIDEAAADTSDWLRKFTDENEGKLIAELEEKGMTVIIPDISGFREKAKDVSLDPKLAEWVKRMQAVQ